jgi:hypothetical protein
LPRGRSPWRRRRNVAPRKLNSRAAAVEQRRDAAGQDDRDISVLGHGTTGQPGLEHAVDRLSCVLLHPVRDTGEPAEGEMVDMSFGAERRL